MTGEAGRGIRSWGERNDRASHVRVHGPKVTVVQKRYGCGSIRADLTTLRPEATPENASVLSDRSAQDLPDRTRIHFMRMFQTWFRV